MASRVMVPLAAKPKLKQEEWDEAVNTNVEDFDLPVRAKPRGLGVARWATRAGRKRKPPFRGRTGRQRGWPGGGRAALLQGSPHGSRTGRPAHAPPTARCPTASSALQPDEAVESARKEFELQGYDLSAVIMSATGGNVDA
jgi:hypothetical protein